MNIDIKIGTQTELRRWLHRQKKNGNAVKYVAVEDPRTNQRVMLVWKDADLKVCRPSPSSSISNAGEIKHPPSQAGERMHQ